MSAVTTHSSVSKAQLSNPEIRSLARSIGLGGFGGLLCAYLLYLRFPQLRVDGIFLKDILFFGSALGFCLHRLFSSLIGKTLKPVYDCVAYYALVIQLEIQHHRGLIGKDDYQTIKKRLDYAYFLGEHGNKDGSAIRVETDYGAVEQNREVQPKTIKRPRVVASIKTPPAPRL